MPVRTGLAGVDADARPESASSLAAAEELPTVVVEPVWWPIASAALLPVISSNAVSAPIARTNTPAATTATRPQRIRYSPRSPPGTVGDSVRVPAGTATRRPPPATDGVPTAAGAVTKVATICLWLRSMNLR